MLVSPSATMGSSSRHPFMVLMTTCSIDKTSSAELSEAINSMFLWYQKAGICYAYLSDIEWFQHSCDIYDCYQTLRLSRWFTRGWTLQELLAPAHVKFMSSDWRALGTKLQLCDTIVKITGVSGNALLGQALSDFNVAERMSWASRRQTTRLEDLAYCLLGIFDVNMPLLYGEGGKAFLRLQEHILERSEDYTIFTWQAATNTGDLPLLASAPSDFKEAGTEPFDREWQYSDLSSMSDMISNHSSVPMSPCDNENHAPDPPVATSRGIRMQMNMIDLSDGRYRTLICPIKAGEFDENLWLCLELRQPQSSKDIMYRQGNSWTIEHAPDLKSATLRQIYGARTKYERSTISLQEQRATFLNRVVNELLLSERPAQPVEKLAQRLCRGAVWCPRCSSYTPRFKTRAFRGVLCGRCDRLHLKIEIEKLEKLCGSDKSDTSTQEVLERLRHTARRADTFQEHMITDRQLLQLEASVQNIYARPTSSLATRQLRTPLMGLLLCCLIAVTQDRIANHTSKRLQLAILKDFARILETSRSIGHFAFQACDEHSPFASRAGPYLLRVMLKCCAVFAEEDARDIISVKIAWIGYARYVERQVGSQAMRDFLRPSPTGDTDSLIHSTPHEVMGVFQGTLLDQPRLSEQDKIVDWLRQMVHSWSEHMDSRYLCLTFDVLKDASHNWLAVMVWLNPSAVDTYIVAALMHYHFWQVAYPTYADKHMAADIRKMAAGNQDWQRILERVLPNDKGASQGHSIANVNV